MRNANSLIRDKKEKIDNITYTISQLKQECGQLQEKTIAHKTDINDAKVIIDAVLQTKYTTIDTEGRSHLKECQAAKVLVLLREILEGSNHSHIFPFNA